MIKLPFPSSALAGHANGNANWGKIKATKEHRQWAKLATLEAKPRVPDSGDISVCVRFVPPHNRGDRVNYPNRLKPYYDGIADALGVNDKRFVPHFIFEAPQAPGWVEVYIG